MTPLSTQQLEELLSLEKKATKGPWEVVEHNWSDTSIYSNKNEDLVCSLSIEDIATEETQEELESDMGATARLIATSRNTIRSIVEELLAAREVVKEARETYEPHNSMRKVLEAYDQLLKTK